MDDPLHTLRQAEPTGYERSAKQPFVECYVLKSHGADVDGSLRGPGRREPMLCAAKYSNGMHSTVDKPMRLMTDI